MFLGPKWTDEDRGYSLALLAYEASLCEGCGLPLSETTAVKDGRHVHSYDVDDPDICGACAALAVKVSDYQTDNEDPARTAAKWQVTRRT